MDWLDWLCNLLILFKVHTGLVFDYDNEGMYGLMEIPRQKVTEEVRD